MVRSAIRNREGVGVRRKHHDLLVWRESMDLVTDIYRVTSSYPREEIYGLTSQMRRAAVSVPSNIAEGAARTSNKEFLQFLSIARGSLSELETQIMISRNLGYLSEEGVVLQRVETIFALLGGLMKSIRARS